MGKSKKNQLFGILLLLLTSLIWGFAFVAQSDAMNYIGPLTMNGTRTLLAALFLLPIFLIGDKVNGTIKYPLGVKDKTSRKHLLVGGLLCGISITIASSVQQIGIQYTTVGKSGFLTTLYVAFVPIISIFLGKKVKWNAWLGVLVSLIGMFFICVHEDLSINIGDILIVISAFFFAVQIIIVDKYITLASGIKLSFLQFVVCSVVCLTGAFIFEQPNITAILNAWLPICFAGILSAGVGYTLQILAQRWVAPTIAPLIMCLESVFALLGGALLKNEVMSKTEYFGCALVFIAIVVAQISLPKTNKKQLVKEQ